MVLLVLEVLLFVLFCPFFLCSSKKKNSSKEGASPMKTPEKTKTKEASREPSKKKKRKSERHVKREKEESIANIASAQGGSTSKNTGTPVKKATSVKGTPSILSADEVAPSPDAAAVEKESKKKKEADTSKEEMKQEDSLDKLQPQVREAVRTPEIKGQLAKNEGDYKTLNKKMMADFSDKISDDQQ